MYILFFLASFLLSLGAVLIVRWLAVRYGFVDRPDTVRKLHHREVPLLGGVAIAAAFWFIVLCLIIFFPQSLFLHIKARQLIGIFIGSCIILAIGILDDKYNLSPSVRLSAIILTALVAVMSGITIHEITHPLGGVIKLDFWTLPGWYENIGIIPFFVITGWLVGMMHTTKILDGLDGLATGIVLIGALMIFVLSSLTRFYQPDVALLSIVFSGVLAGFLFFNFYPAKIFLGESGSIFIGFILGVLAVISGGKIATALLAMGVPILDLARVIVVRVKRGQPISMGDREHLHFLLLDRGWNQHSVVLFLYGVSLIFGLMTFLFQSMGKLLMLGFLMIITLTFSLFISKKK